MKKIFNILNILLILAVCVGDIIYMFVDHSLLTKSLVSAGFVIIGIINLIFALKNNTDKKKFAIIMLVGLTFAMLGDIILEIEFIIGAALFAIGHIFYFIAYCFLLKFQWKDLIYGAVIFVPVTLFIILAPIFDFGGILMEMVCIIYALIISCMVGKAIANFIKEKSVLHLIILIGSALFMFSDFMLLLNLFADMPRIILILCLSTYYPAECLLAFSIYKTNK